jgi:predicted PurR-regulated permease PerM
MRIERHIVFWIAAFLVFLGLLWLLHDILLPFVLGAALAYLLDPLVNRLVRIGVSRLLAALIILVALVLVLVGLFVVIAPLFAGQLSSFIEHLPEYVRRLKEFLSDPNHPWLRGMLESTAGSNWSVGALAEKAAGYLTGALPTLWSKGEALLSVFSLFIVTPVVAFYLLLDWPRIVNAADDLIPLPQRDTVRGLAREIDMAISGYLHGQLIVCVILGCYYALGLTLAGLSFGLLIGVISGFLTFIPYIGSLTALVASFAFALAQFFPDWTRILIIVGLVLIGQFFEGNVLSPKLVGESAGLHPVWLIFALLAFGYLFGFIGLLLAVPVAAAAGVLTRFALRRYRASPFYTGSQSS